MASDHGQSGNTLVLFPAAVLIVFGLGALAIDAATIFLGQRRLADLAASVANDAVAAIDLAAFYQGQEDLRIDPVRASTRAEQLRSGVTQDRSLEEVACALEVDGQAVTVRCTGRARPILAPFWPVGATRDLTASETATGQQR